MRLVKGDADAFTVIFNNYFPRIYSSILVISKSATLAEDIAQEVFTRLWQEHGKAAEINDLSSYLFIAARNKVLNRLSRVNVEAAYQSYLLHQDQQPEKAEQVTYRELDQLIRSGMQQLTPQQQRAFQLSRLQGYTYEQIAAEMQISRSTVKDHIVKALAALRQYLKANGYASLYFILFNILFG